MPEDRLSGAFTYVSMADLAAASRRSVMPIPPHPPDPGVPVFWADWLDDAQYFINDSADTLDRVVVGSGGFITTDDGVLMKTGTDREYRDVRPGEAVRIDRYDPYEDGLVQVIVTVKSPTYGAFRVSLMRHASQGGLPRQVILWDDGTPARGASVTFL